MKKEIICEAIRKRKLISFFYKGGIRIVEPYLLGLNKTTDNLTLSAWFLRGASESSSSPNWRNYLVEDMTSISILEASFNPNPPRYGYNRLDSKMSAIYCRI